MLRHRPPPSAAAREHPPADSTDTPGERAGGGYTRGDARLTAPQLHYKFTSVPKARVVKQQMSRGGSARAGPSKYYRDFNDSAGLAVEDDYGQGHAQTVPTTSSTRISNPRCEMGIP